MHSAPSPLSRAVRFAFALLLALQSVWLPLDALAYVEPAAVVSPQQEEPPPIDEDVVDEEFVEVPGVDEDDIVMPERVTLEEIPDPLVPAVVSLSTVDVLLRPDQPVQLDVAIWRYADAETDLRVQIELPETLGALEAEALAWTLPAQVGDEQAIKRQLNLAWRNELVGNSGAVVDVVVRIEGEGYLTVEESVRLGSADAPIEGPDLVTETVELVQDVNGVVLQGGGNVAVLAPPEAVEVGTVFRYTELFRAGAERDDAERESETDSAELGETLSAPVEAEEAVAGDALAQEPSEKEAVEPQWIDGVLAYQMWQLDALSVGQVGADERTDFRGSVLVRIDAQWLVDAGVNPDALDLWTREDATQPWARVPTRQRENSPIFTAELKHFSEFTLGSALDAQRDLLPSTTHMTSDLHTGAANVTVPIEVPQGLGGLAPALSLSYSSSSVDDVHAENDADEYRVQAGMAGLGWNLGGISYIALVDGDAQSNTSEHEYQLVLNGASTQIRGTQAYPESFARIEKNLGIPSGSNGKVYFAGEWIVTTPDGTKHYFGSTQDPRILDSNGKLNGFAYQSLTVGQQSWTVTKWYLRQSIDPLGNRIHYNYNWEMGQVGLPPGNGCSTNSFYNQQMYHRDVRPSEILWSSNHLHDATYRMRVDFDYETRNDYKVVDYQYNNCRQVSYSHKRLKRINVQIRDTGNTWRQVRRYELTYRYSLSKPCDRSFNCYHSLLESIRERGLRNNTFNVQNFTYVRPGNAHGEIHLRSADNGRGGIATYAYGQVKLKNCSVVTNYTINEACVTNDAQRRRWSVSSIVMDDGLNNSYKREYGYNYNNQPAIQIERFGAKHYLGHERVRVKHYARNSNSVQKQEETWFYQGSIGSSAGEMGKPDPRVGRSYRTSVHRPKGNGCSAWQLEDISGYCRMAQTATHWTAWHKSGSSWAVSNDYAARPLWVRQEHVIEWVDGAQDERYFYYETSRQNGHQFGNVTKVEEAGQGVNNRLRATTFDFFPNTSDHIVNLPARTRVYGSGGDCHAETRMVYGRGQYGQHYRTQPMSAMVAKTEQALTGCSNTTSIGNYDGNWSITHYGHDVYGNVTTEHSLGTNSSHNVMIKTVYDLTYHLFPIRQYNEHRKEFEETAKYWGINLGSWGDGRLYWGAMGEHCGVNRTCTRQAYDEFGRATYRWERIAAGAPWANSSTAIEQEKDDAHTRWLYHGYGELGQTRNVVTEWHAPRCDGTFVRRHYNGLGQLVQEQTPDQNWRVANVENKSCSQSENLEEIDVSYEYDALGNQTRASVPHRTNTGWVNRAFVWSLGYTSTNYDVLGRPTQSVAPNGEVTNYAYSGRAWHAYASRSGTHRTLTWQKNNELGQLREVRSWRYSGGWQTHGTVVLSHDKLDNLTRVDHADGLGATTMQYDAASRKTSMVDPDLGHWTYAYDRQGRLTRQTDARGCTTLMEHDPRLGRLINKWFRRDNRPGGGATECPSYAPSYVTEYRYDANHSTINRSRGQMTSITKKYNGGTSYQRSYWYNSLGLLASERVSIGGAPQTYTTRHYYDVELRPYRIQYPDNDSVTWSYNSMGLPLHLSSSQRGTLIDSAAYTEAGQLTRYRMTRGTDLWRKQTYYSWTGGNGEGNRRLSEIRVGTTDGSYNRLRLYHQYDSFGNVTRLDERYNNGSTAINTFSYDHQNRVTSAFGRNFSWRASGNFNQFNGASYTYDATHRHAVDRVNGVDRYDYDRNGNMRYRNKGAPSQQRLYFDHENHFLYMRNSNNQTIERYFYDDNGIRVKKTAGNTVTFYPFPHYEVTVSGVAAASASAAEDEEATPVVELVSEALLAQPGPTDAELNATVDNEPVPLDRETCAPDVEVCELPELEDGPPEAAVELETSEQEAEAAQETIADSAPGSTLPPHSVHLPLISSERGSGVNAAAANSTTQVTKYYFFNGQRVMLYVDGDVPYPYTVYLHADRLGSTVLETNYSGGRRTTQSYFAFGARRGGSSPSLLATENQFTGQKKDDTGLYYYNARYYDPELGQFISPDTIVPDPSRVLAYNRYLYGYGNPLKYTDPTGHCAVTLGGGSDLTNDADCWRYADTILAQWDATEATAAYWNNRFTSQEVFRDHVATSAPNDLAFMEGEWGRFMESNAGRAWHEALWAAADPLSQAYRDDPMCGEMGLCQTLVRPALATEEYCAENDCVALGLDSVATTSAGVAAACAAGVITAGCSLPSGSVSVIAGGLGAGWTLHQVTQGKADEVDLATSTTTFIIGISTPPEVGFGASIFQTFWDLFRPERESPNVQ